MNAYLTHPKRELIVSLGIILGLSHAQSFAAPGPESNEAAAAAPATVKKTNPRKKHRAAPASSEGKAGAAAPSAGGVPGTDQPAAPAVTPAKPQGKPGKAAKTEKPEELYEIKVVSGRSRNLLGMTGSASQGEIGQAQIEFRAMSRPGELVELIPGMIATQHSGSGKANQYFLRGYNLDHGTDFTTVVDGVPMNMPSHAHGQGYMDLNSMIPELVDKIEYGKGPYYAEIGDFAAAGFNKMTTMKSLPRGILKFTGGEFDYYRTVAANSSKLGEGDLLYGAEFQAYNGAWAVPENGHKYNGVLRYTQDHDNWGMALNAKAYTNAWTATNQVAQAAIDDGYIGIYGNLSPSDGGDTNRYSFSSNVWNTGKDWKNDANLYMVYYDLNLYSNFTGYLNGPQGDQVNQREHRVQVGGNEEFTSFDKLFGLDMDNTYGLSFRHDEITGLGLYQTVNRQYLNTISDDNVSESTGGMYFKNQIHWTEKFRTIQALRADFITMQVDALANAYTTGNAQILAQPASSTTAYSPYIAAGSLQAADPSVAAAINAANSGYKSKEMISPKFSAILGPYKDTEYFLNYGYGYHSNDARGALETVNPQTNNTTSADGSLIRQITPMAWARGGEVGARSNYIPGLNSTLALWYLQSSSELVFDGDSGTTTANGMSDRYGLELTNYYKVNDWVTLDLDYSRSYGHFSKVPQSVDGGCPTARPNIPCIGSYIPNLVGTVIAAGVQVTAPNGMFGSLRLRHFGDSPLDSDGSIWAPNVDILNLGLGYRQKSYRLDFSLFNLLGETTSDIAYAYQYGLMNPTNNTISTPYGVVRHPVEPRMARAGFTIYF